MTGLAVAAVSARLMAEAAADDGFDVVALDLFGDADTRRVARAWRPIGTATGFAIDAESLLSCLSALAHDGGLIGWVPGGGFESRCDLLADGAGILPLIGTSPDAVRRVREPRLFFDALGARGIAHPAIRFEPPLDPAGWLVKDAGGTGGWHVRRWTGDLPRPTAPGSYFQREVLGRAMSATFVANGRDVCVLGFNELAVRRLSNRPFVYAGLVGPLTLEPKAAGCATAAVEAVAADFGLRGLGSLDFLLVGDEVQVLEVNPRPPASLGLYRGAVEDGVLRAHVMACLHDALPALRPQPAALQGAAIVYARREMTLDAKAVDRLAQWPACHDVPAAPTIVRAEDPLCSLTAVGPTADAVRARLAYEEERLLAALEETTCPT